MRILGIIGGLGPETSAKFQLEVISFCLKINKDQRPPLLLWNIPVPLKVEEKLILENKAEDFLSLLVDAAKILEKGGADFVAMPCNTLHIFIEEIRNSIKIPVLSIIDETIKVIKQRKIKKIGILATSATIRHDLFGSKLKENNIEQVTPNKMDQSALDNIIHKTVTGKLTQEDKKEVNKIIEKLERCEVKNILLACTDLQLIIKSHPRIKILDTMLILAKASSREILKGVVKTELLETKRFKK